MTVVEEIEPDVSAEFFSSPVEKAYETLRFQWEDLELYRAADPGYPRNFNRDVYIAARLSRNSKMAYDQLRYASNYIGIKFDAATGEEPGKDYHEFRHDLPDAIHDGMSTRYNACDTTALALCSIADIAESGARDVLEEFADSIDARVGYITSHIRDGLFIEDPKICGAEHYGLKVTYWKDSVLNDPNREQPSYPIVYTQAHFQNAEALYRIGKLRNDETLVAIADQMYGAGFEKLWHGDHFIVARDAEGIIDPPSSDTLMSLLHIPVELLPEGFAEAVENYMTQLETKAGYRTGIKVGKSDDDYHTKYVWTHEQGLLHMAAARHGLLRAMEVTQRVLNYITPEIGSFPELLYFGDKEQEFLPAGNKLQLWTVAMYEYMIQEREAVLPAS